MLHSFLRLARKITKPRSRTIVTMHRCLHVLFVLSALNCAAVAAAGEQRTLVILDTDIGTDIDDAYALAAVLHRPDLRLLGVTTVSSDAQARARLAAKLLNVAGAKFKGVPVYAGSSSPHQYMQQVEWSKGFESRTLHQSGAMQFMREQIKHYPNEITLIAIGELTNVAALIRSDPTSARKLRAISLMGGSIYRGYEPGSAPEPEWNIKSNVGAARIVFASGIPLYVAPLDSTADLKLGAKRRATVFSVGTAFNDALAALDFIWSNTKPWNADAPTLFDVLAVQLVGAKAPCPLTPLHVDVTEQGITQVAPDAAPNANVALRCDSTAVLDDFVQLLETQ